MLMLLTTAPWPPTPGSLQEMNGQRLLINLICCWGGGGGWRETTSWAVRLFSHPGELVLTPGTYGKLVQ